MAHELAVYPDRKRIVAHRVGCETISSVPRVFRRGHTVDVEPAWQVIACGNCKPYIFVVHVTSKRVRGETEGDKQSRRQDREQADHFSKPARNRADRSWPPHGTVALDITHSPHAPDWRQRGLCQARGRLGVWLKWLFMTEHSEQWAVTVQKVLCSECPVRAECLEQGVWGGEKWGIWGGATLKERRALKSKWLREGRKDERPERDAVAISVRGKARSGRTTKKRDVPTGTGKASSAYEAAREDMREVWPESDVQEPGPDGVAIWDWRESLGDWGGTGEA